MPQTVGDMHFRHAFLSGRMPTPERLRPRLREHVVSLVNNTAYDLGTAYLDLTDHVAHGYSRSSEGPYLWAIKSSSSPNHACNPVSMPPSYSMFAQTPVTILRLRHHVDHPSEHLSSGAEHTDRLPTDVQPKGKRVALGCKV